MDERVGVNECEVLTLKGRELRLGRLSVLLRHATGRPLPHARRVGCPARRSPCPDRLLRDGSRDSSRVPRALPHVRLTLAISCEGRTTAPWSTMTMLPKMMVPPASNRPSSAASRCSTAGSIPRGRHVGAGAVGNPATPYVGRDGTPRIPPNQECCALSAPTSPVVHGKPGVGSASAPPDASLKSEAFHSLLLATGAGATTLRGAPRVGK
jgi:hypothetical protein